MESPKTHSHNHNKPPCCKKPLLEAIKPDTYWLCSCGKSTYYPHCDGSHKGTGKKPIKFHTQSPQTICWHCVLNNKTDN